MMQPFVNSTKKATNISQSCDPFLRELHANGAGCRIMPILSPLIIKPWRMKVCH